MKNIVLLVGLLGCDRTTAPPIAAVASGSVAQPSATVSPPLAPSASAPDCDVAVRHADAVMRKTGSPSVVSLMFPVETSIAACKSDRWSPEILGCVMGQTDIRGVVYGCYAKALDGSLTIKRRFNALDNNTGVSPPVGTVDGDYTAVDATCGSLVRITPPATAVYYICGDTAQGPVMLADDIRELFGALAQDEATRHKIVSDLVARTKVTTHRVDTYDQQGNYQGTHTEF